METIIYANYSCIIIFVFRFTKKKDLKLKIKYSK